MLNTKSLRAWSLLTKQSSRELLWAVVRAKCSSGEVEWEVSIPKQEFER